MKSETDDSKLEGDSGEIVPELKDPMSGYVNADGLGSESIASMDAVKDERLRDPMSGYSSADALESRPRVNEEGVDHIHADEMKDAMSGYASADAMEPDQK